MTIATILVGVDFSEASRRALDVAVDIARGGGARLELVFAQEVLTYRGVRYEEVLSPGARKQEREEAERRLKEWHELAEAAGVRCRERVVDGDARHVILETAAETDADLIVLGAKGSSRLRDLVLGSVAQEISRQASCSVLLAR